MIGQAKRMPYKCLLRRCEFWGSTGCQPVVAGSPAATSFTARFQWSYDFPRPCKAAETRRLAACVPTKSPLELAGNSKTAQPVTADYRLTGLQSLVPLTDSGEGSAWDAALVCAGAWEWMLA